MNDETFKKSWVGGICINENKILLIHRINNEIDFNKEYFVFPGKELQDDETIETALTKAFEDISVIIQLEDLYYSNEEDPDENEYYYMCNYVLGDPAVTSDSDEAKKMEVGSQVYIPMWVDFSELEDLIVYPESVKVNLLETLSPKTY